MRLPTDLPNLAAVETRKRALLSTMAVTNINTPDFGQMLEELGRLCEQADFLRRRPAPRL